MAAMLTAPIAHAQSVAAAVAAHQHRVLSVDARVSGRLVRVDGAGKRSSTKFLLKAHGFADGVRLLEELQTPQPLRVLVRLEPSGRVTARLAHKDAAGKWLPESAPARLTDPLAGSGFTLEDLVDAQFFWKEQALAGRAPCGSRQCVTLKSVASAADHSQYASVASSFDEKTNALIHVVKTVRGSGVVKDMTYSNFHVSHGVTAAAQIELKVAGMAGSNLFVIDHGTAKANLTRADFDLGSSTLEDPNHKDEDY
jgi:hypothetical protein